MMSVNRLRDLFVQPASIYARPLVRRIVLGLAFFSLFMLILSADFVPDKVSLDIGQVSDRDVIAPRTVSYVDTVKTKQLEAEVLVSVPSVFDLDMGVMGKVDEEISAIFQASRVVAADKSLTTPLIRLERLQNSVPLPLAATTVQGLLSLDDTGLSKSEEYSRNILRKYLHRGVREDDREIVLRQIIADIAKSDLNADAQTVVAGLSQFLLRPNFLLNIRETDKRKQAAIANVEPVRVTVKQGQVLVRSGDVVSAEQLQVMDEIGLYAGQVNQFRIFGLAVYVLIAFALTLGYLYKFAQATFDNDLHLLLLSFIVLVTLFIGKAAHYYSDFSAPVAAGALLAAILISPRVGIMTGIVMAMLFGIIVNYNLRAVIAPLVGSIVGVYSVTKTAHGYSLTRAGVWVGAVNCLVIGSTGLVEQVNSSQLLLQCVLGIFSGIAAAVITTGFLPYLEHAFNITTPIKLLDFAKPNHPLLQRLLLDAPGTYHHSVMVGNLAETAADAVEADPVLVRVGAYYHDIGKIKRPYFFVENQVDGENPHDKIAPSLSTLIVTSHIKDGVDLCRDYKVPQVIIDIVEQHHGTTLVSYFYKRATETEHGDCIIEADFRYEGPRPQTKEAALIMLADACEASVRSLSKPNSSRIEGMVRKIIREKLHDGQLDECNLTLKDLTIIGDVFIRILSSMFHSRIEYPDSWTDLERKKIRNGNGNKSCARQDETNSSTGTNSSSGNKQDS